MRKRGRKDINLNIKLSNRWLYTIIAIAIIAVVSVSVYAYGTTNPTTFGHSAGELNVDVNGDGTLDKSLQAAIDAGDIGGGTWDSLVATGTVPSGFADGADNVGGAEVVACDTILATADAERISTAGTFTRVKLKEITMSKGSGTIRATWDMKSKASTLSANSRIYINDVIVTTERQTKSTTYVSYSEDVPVSEGDKIQLWVRGNNAYVRNFRVKGCISSISAQTNLN